MERRLRRTRIKVCGLTREEDVDAAVEAGVDAIGFILFPGDPRMVSADRAVELAKRLPPFVTPVVVFSNAKVHEILLMQENMPDALLQFHGQEEASWCESWGRPFLKAIPVEANTDLIATYNHYSVAQALLLDAPGVGSNSFDWSLIPKDISPRVVLSGGLKPGNVKQAILIVQPWAVNICSGIESAPGIKDTKLLHQFVQAVRLADACLFESTKN